jgi:UDPglucose 6-dehydrogenase
MIEKRMKIGVVGNGVVGSFLVKSMERAGHAVAIYDPGQEAYSSEQMRLYINVCDLVFVAVPTPCDEYGACDLSNVEDAIAWIEPPICIKSTVAPGTTDRLVKDTGKRIVFSPEYIGETPFHRYNQRLDMDVIAVGGDENTCELFLNLFRSVFGPEPRYFQTSAVTAELAKYMENCFFALKVAFVGQFFILSKVYGAQFTALREIWTADPRVGRSHSTVTGGLGFGGKCLPKDLSAIVASANEVGANASLLESIQQFNRMLNAIIL